MNNDLPPFSGWFWIGFIYGAGAVIAAWVVS